jgi:hypothetical protein
MSSSTAWVQESVQPQFQCEKGNLALLREAAAGDAPRTVAGVSLPPEVARILMMAYERLPPLEQELFAARCNTDLADWVRHCLGSLAAFVLSRGLVSGVVVQTKDGKAIVSLLVAVPDDGQETEEV